MIVTGLMCFNPVCAWPGQLASELTKLLFVQDARLS